MSQVVDALEEARAASARQSWRAAYGAFTEAGDGGLTASDLENYGEAAWWSGKLDEAISLRERAYSAYTATGDLLGAARMALTIQWDYEARGSFAVANGWLANAERLLADLPEAPEHARLGLIKALTAMFAQGDYERAITLFDEAYELAIAGRRSRQPDARPLGKGSRAHQARRDRRGPLAPRRGDGLGDVRRPARPLLGARLLHHDQLLPGPRRLPPRGRVDRRSQPLLRQARRVGLPGGVPHPPRRGPPASRRLVGAEAQAMAACEELHDFDRSITAIRALRDRRDPPSTRRLRGRGGGVRISNEMGREPQPGLALLRLAEGKVDAAVAGITLTLQDAAEPLFRLRRLPAQVEIAIAAGDLKTARAAADEAEQIVDSYKIGNKRAAAFDGRALRARADPRRREGLAERDRVAATRARRMAGRRCSVRDSSGADAPRHRVHARRATSTPAIGELESGARDLRAPGRGPRRDRAQGAPRPGRGTPDVPLHGHRRLDEAARDARRRQVEATARAPRRARPRAHRRDRRRGR